MPDQWSTRGDLERATAERAVRVARERAAADAAVAAFVVGYWSEHGYGPSMRDVALHLGVKLPSAQRRIIRAHLAGLLVYTPGVSRTLSTPELRDGMRRLAQTIAILSGGIG